MAVWNLREAIGSVHRKTRLESMLAGAKLLLLAWAAACLANAQTVKPNMVLVLTDDLDLELGSMKALVRTQSLLGEGGVTFANTYVTTPLCCPSRSSILTGRYAHNAHVANNSLSGNCSSLMWQRGPEREAFVVALQAAGYETFYAGKYLNKYGYKRAGGVEHVPVGWDHWAGLVGNSVYYNYTLSVNGVAEKHGDDPNKDYLTDVMTKHWIVRRAVHPIPEEVVSWIDEAYRNRLRTLLSVDEMVADIIHSLASKLLLNNTYVFFTSDNGYHLGQFSQPKDKRQPYETDIHVPLLVRGPGVEAGRVEKGVALNVDLAPTFLDLAGLPPKEKMDGVSLKPLLHKKGDSNWPRHAFLVEYSGEGEVHDKSQCHAPYGVAGCDPAVQCECEDSWNNTYLCTRQIMNDVNTKLCEFKDNEGFMEAYNLTWDPFEIQNLYFLGVHGLSHGDEERSCLQRLRHCRRESCYLSCWKNYQ
ncbi:N-acetylglucosamine-6-sulfatase-like isoform X2 [Haemaphysalis longicornis]